ncbi:MAG: hypothetical protein OXI46_03990 [Gemmatimonadota bacterium]|nr:hypothetical protein [Gemmatimonadota bacterium]
MIRHTFSNTDSVGDVSAIEEGAVLLADNPNASLVLLTPSDAAATWGIQLQGSVDGVTWETLDTYDNDDDAAIQIRVARGLDYRFRLSAVVSAGTVRVTLIS